nr:pyridoxamine 5'-phosphate oxidase family protein [uncultured Victivallis sp.]
MKKREILSVMVLLCAAVLVFCGCRSVDEMTENKEENTMTMQDVYQFLKDAGVYYIATVDGDQPRVRPFGTIHIFEGKLYIQTGRKKNVSRQLGVNGKTELCAMKGDEWIRLSGTLVDDNRREAKASMLDAYPSLKKMYSPDDDNTQVLYFKDATATIYSFSHDPVVIKF